jgi:hypothetical protein
LHNIQAFFTGLPKPLVVEAEAARTRAAAERSAASMAAAVGRKPPGGGTKKVQGGTAKSANGTTTTTAAAHDAPQFVAGELDLAAGGPKPVPPLDPSHGTIFDGDAALKGIAEHGAEWRREFVRREDMEVRRGQSRRKCAT